MSSQNSHQIFVLTPQLADALMLLRAASISGASHHLHGFNPDVKAGLTLDPDTALALAKTAKMSFEGATAPSTPKKLNRIEAVYFCHRGESETHRSLSLQIRDHANLSSLKPRRFLSDIRKSRSRKKSILVHMPRPHEAGVAEFFERVSLLLDFIGVELANDEVNIVFSMAGLEQLASEYCQARYGAFVREHHQHPFVMACHGQGNQVLTALGFSMAGLNSLTRLARFNNIRCLCVSTFGFSAADGNANWSSLWRGPVIAAGGRVADYLANRESNFDFGLPGSRRIADWTPFASLVPFCLCINPEIDNAHAFAPRAVVNMYNNLSHTAA